MPMLPQHIQFLTAVLGHDGAQALQKAADRSEDLGNALVPRAILSWLGTSSRFDYEGEIPGIKNSYVCFTKSENGFDGSIDLHGEIHSFKNASIFHLAASVATSLSIGDELLPTGIRQSEIEKLGRSCDLLAKSRILSEALSKAEKEKQEKSYECPGKEGCTNAGCISRGHVLEKNKDSHGGAAGKGAAASAIAPAMPLPPTAVQPEQPRITAKLPKLPGSAQVPKLGKSIAISKSEAGRACSICGNIQFYNNEFMGCVCLRSLAKSTTTNKTDDGYVVKLDEEWDRDAIFTLFEAIGRIK
jgi:hypothetical protein